MIVKIKNKDIYIINEKEFVPKNIFENGQAFRWKKNYDNSYTAIMNKYVIEVKKLDEDEISKLYNEDFLDEKYKDVVVLKNAGDINDYNNFFKNYFDMEKDYKEIRKFLAEKDENLKNACDFGVGLRILNQDLFEMIISFIISANNQIPKIKSSIEKICELCGDKIENTNLYKFPTVEQLSNVSIEDLKSVARVGYRAEYINKTANMIKNKEFDLDKINKLDYFEAHTYLCTLSGVGPKVADCILLFGNKRKEAFPVDTWVYKFMNKFYLDNVKNPKKIKEAGISIFGENAGLAQQYLFFYARENKINLI